MTITFITKSKKDVSQVYLRLKDTTFKIDTMCGIGISVLKSQFEKGVLKNTTSKPSDSAISKAETNQQNREIDKQNNRLEQLKKKVTYAYNNRNTYDVINSKWIKQVINADLIKDKTPNEFVKYYEYYIDERKNELSSASIKKHKNVKNRFAEYEKFKKTNILIQQLDNQFKADFKKWFIDVKGYHFNTFKKQIKELVTVCNYAQSVSKKTLNPDTSRLNTGKAMKPIETNYIALSFKDLKQIELTELKTKELDVTRDLLLISCYTAQRVGDFLNYSSDNIVTLDDGQKYLDIVQSKTKKQVYIPLNDVVLKILKKYNGEFPPLYSNSRAFNEQTFNKIAKRVGYHCKINEIVESHIKENNRLVSLKAEKYNFITSHSGRRSFSTNYYGKIDTSLIITITGHADEKTFKSYVKAKPEDLAKGFTQKLKELNLSTN
jgi:integrase